ncbi:MAG TPA: triose-phosphate isomerase [Rhizomicrobium sp.]|nr:triose-phosphate isomerase [Rhizomicrobium sp.]
MRPLIAGNWKMHGTGPSLSDIVAVACWVAGNPVHADVLICPPFTLLSRAVATAGGRIAIGGQDCHERLSGAFTGDVSAEMLSDAGATAVIVGHSERRHYHGESDMMVAAKAKAAWRAGLLAIICIGETEEEHDAGQSEQVVLSQLDASVPAGLQPDTTAIAYEPVWAIGSGRTPTGREIGQMHELIRERLDSRFPVGGRFMPILYGGSVKPANAREILALPNVNGALVGGASLKAEEFLAIIRSAPGQ